MDHGRDGCIELVRRNMMLVDPSDLPAVKGLEGLRGLRGAQIAAIPEGGGDIARPGSIDTGRRPRKRATQ